MLTHITSVNYDHTIADTDFLGCCSKGRIIIVIEQQQKWILNQSDKHGM